MSNHLATIIPPPSYLLLPSPTNQSSQSNNVTPSLYASFSTSNPIIKIPDLHIASLSKYSPFKFLTYNERLEIAGLSKEFYYSPNQTVMKQGENIDGVYIILSGSVYIIDELTNKRLHVSEGFLASKKAVFGELEAILKCKIRYTINADSKGATCLLVPLDVFLTIVNVSKPFSESIALIVRPMVKLFHTTDLFIREIDNVILTGEANFDKVLSIYKDMNSTLHPQCNTDTLDLGALNYALRRLPNNVTRTHLWILGNQPPENLDPSGIMLLTSSPARRRACWDMNNGMAFVLLSDNLTDLADLFTCMSCYTIEAKKLRTRLTQYQEYYGNDIFEALKKANRVETIELQKKLLSPVFTDDEFLKLHEIWPTDLLHQCWEIIVHHENFSFKIQKNKMTRVMPVDVWSENIRVAALELFPDLETAGVSIISSNTHSVINLISPWVHKNKLIIIEWGKKNEPGSSDKFDNQEDLLYYYLHRYLKAHPEVAIEKENVEKEHGIITIDEMFGTGISVQLIDAKLLDVEFCDSSLDLNFIYHERLNCGNHLIVNIDFAFGKQAETILNSLILLFGKNIRSLNVLGKAGAIVGKRGDILMPTHFIMFDEENPKTLLNQDLSVASLRKYSNKSDVYHGPILTVLGTFVQNFEMLHYFEKLWNCIGLEMEGSYYTRAMERGLLKGLLLPTITSRFLYYVSDVPLAISGKLSEKLEPWEGIPPLYATTRAIMNNVIMLDSRKHCAVDAVSAQFPKPIVLTRFASSSVKPVSQFSDSFAHLKRLTSVLYELPPDTK